MFLEGVQGPGACRGPEGISGPQTPPQVGGVFSALEFNFSVQELHYVHSSVSDPEHEKLPDSAYFLWSVLEPALFLWSVLEPALFRWSMLEPAPFLWPVLEPASSSSIIRFAYYRMNAQT